MGVATFFFVVALLVIPVLAFIVFYRMRKPEDIVKEYAGTDDDKSVFIKKYERADINRQHTLFLQVGLSVSLAIILLAFSYAPKEDDTSSMETGSVIIEEEEMIPQTNQAKPPPPPPPPPPEVVEVEDDIEVEDQPDLFDSEMDVDVDIETQAYIPEAPVIKKEEPKEPEIFVVVEQMPEFPGGEKALYEFLAKNIKYPAVAKENGIEGKVYIKFVVNEDGSVSQAQIVRGIGGGCDEEALKVVKQMPKWKPGKQRGKTVKVWYTLPVYFKLA
jgi:protein TonB